MMCRPWLSGHSEHSLTVEDVDLFFDDHRARAADIQTRTGERREDVAVVDTK